MIGSNDLKSALKVDVAVSSEMATALDTWRLMYINQASWLSKDVRPLGLPAAIASEIARSTTIEMTVEVTGSARATFLHEQVQRLLPLLRHKVEYGAALGGLVMKPYISGGQIAVDFVGADAFLPVAFDSSGRVTGIVFVDQKQAGERYYTRLEYHNLAGNRYTVQNLAFVSDTRDTLGRAVDLSQVPEWADLAPSTTIAPVTKPLYGYFKYPLANHIDPRSPLGVSCYARAVDLIQDADEIYYTLAWEFESGRRAMYVDDTAFDRDAEGKPILPDRRLYRALKATSDIGEGQLFQEWSPEFREASIKSGLDAVLKKIEFMTGLAYGTISDPMTVDKTATEIKASQQRSAATITDAQKSLESALVDLIDAMSVLVTITPSLALSVPRGTYQVTAEFDDSLVTDKDAEKLQARQDVTLGVMAKYRYLMITRGLTETEAKAWIAEAQSEQPEPQFPGAASD